MSTDESGPTFPHSLDPAAERALRRDLVLLTRQRRPRRRGRRLPPRSAGRLRPQTHLTA